MLDKLKTPPYTAMPRLLLAATWLQVQSSLTFTANVPVCASAIVFCGSKE
jgi:hypothetical protein